MAVPDRADAAALLLALDPPTWALRHARAVAEVAGWLASQAIRSAPGLDRRTVEAAGLLHDIDKVLPATATPRDLRHGERGAHWLVEYGWAELAPAVASHPVTRLLDGAWFDEWIGTATPEELIVAYADKRAAQRLVSLEARFASWRARYPPRGTGRGAAATWSAADLDAVRFRAGRIETVVSALAGVDPMAVRRLRWTRSALAAAQARPRPIRAAR